MDSKNHCVRKHLQATQDFLLIKNFEVDVTQKVCRILFCKLSQSTHLNLTFCRLQYPIIPQCLVTLGGIH